MNIPFRLVLCILCLIFGVAFSGCAFFRLEKDLEKYEKTFGVVGRIIHAEPDQKNVIVVLFRKTPSGPVMHQACFMDSTAKKYAMVVKKGRYSLFAFADRNNNLTRDKEEPLGYLGKSDWIEVSDKSIDTEKSRSLLGLDFSISASRPLPADFPDRIAISPGIMKNAFARAGDVIRLDDDNLSRA